VGSDSQVTSEFPISERVRASYKETSEERSEDDGASKCDCPTGKPIGADGWGMSVLIVPPLLPARTRCPQRGG